YAKRTGRGTRPWVSINWVSTKLLVTCRGGHMCVASVRSHKVPAGEKMSFPGRQLLQILSYTFGASFILPRHQLTMAAQNSAQPASPAAPQKGSCSTSIDRRA